MNSIIRDLSGKPKPTHNVKTSVLWPLLAQMHLMLTHGSLLIQQRRGNDDWNHLHPIFQKAETDIWSSVCLFHFLLVHICGNEQMDEHVSAVILKIPLPTKVYLNHCCEGVRREGRDAVLWSSVSARTSHLCCDLNLHPKCPCIKHVVPKGISLGGGGTFGGRDLRSPRQALKKASETLILFPFLFASGPIKQASFLDRTLLSWDNIIMRYCLSHRYKANINRYFL